MKAKIIKTGEIVEVYHEPQHGQVSNIYKESVLVNGRMWEEDELDFSINSESKEVVDILSHHPKEYLDAPVVEYTIKVRIHGQVEEYNYPKNKD